MLLIYFGATLPPESKFPFPSTCVCPRSPVSGLQCIASLCARQIYNEQPIKLPQKSCNPANITWAKQGVDLGRRTLTQFTKQPLHR